MPEIFVKTSRRNEIIDVTANVEACLPADLKRGLCTVYCPHTTAGLTVNENADPDVKHDILAKLAMLVPHEEVFYQHCEGNSDAHLKASLMGFSQTVPVRDGKLDLGTWQGIYFCEFDGPRTRRIRVYWQEASF